MEDKEIIKDILIDMIFKNTDYIFNYIENQYIKEDGSPFYSPLEILDIKEKMFKMILDI